MPSGIISSSRELCTGYNLDLQQGKRVGLFGGTFNPPHLGHLHLAQQAMIKLKLDSVWWLINKVHPTKQNNSLYSLSSRIKDTSRLISDQKQMKLLELERKWATVYTCDFIKKLNIVCADTKFVLIIGADQLERLHTWVKWSNLATQIPIAVFDRPDHTYKALNSKFAVRYLNNRLPVGKDLLLTTQPCWQYFFTKRINLSSTMLRRGKLI